MEFSGRFRGGVVDEVVCFATCYFPTKFWGGPMSNSQKLGGSGPPNPCGGCAYGTTTTPFIVHEFATCLFLTNFLVFGK